MGLRDGLDNVEKKLLTLEGLELRPVGRSARSQSLSRFPTKYLMEQKCFQQKSQGRPYYNFMFNTYVP
jgi:hypothetical protein